MKLNVLLERADAVPKGQHRFTRKHSTKTAWKALFADIDIERIFTSLRQCIYTVFADYKAVFHYSARNLVLKIQVDIGVPSNVVNLIVAILQENRVTIDDSMSELSAFSQTLKVII